MKVLILLIAVTKIYSLPDGAPTKACRDLLPIHGRDNPILKQSEPSPFKLSYNFEGDKVLLSVGSLFNVPFQGFVLQARVPGSQEVVGEFESFSEEAKTIDCSNHGDTLTHSRTAEKRRLDVVWDPKGHPGLVYFNGTVAQDFARFWGDVATPTIDLTKRSVDNRGGLSSTSRGISTTTPPYFSPEGKRESSTEFDPFYKGCDVEKTCFGAPAGCVQSKNCKVATTVTVYGDRYEFEVKGVNSPAWVGVGLSDDDKMGGDSVIECVREGSGVRSYMSATSPRPNLGVKRLSRPQEGIELLASSTADGNLYCKVRRDATTNVNGVTFDLQNKKYHLLVATGSRIGSNEVEYHNIALASGEKKSLSDVSPVVAASKLLMRLHGSFMLAAWIGTASIGILLARYYRQTWVGSSMCGKDQWFAWHRFFMVLTWTLTMAGFILIFVHLKAWSSEPNPHAILGVIVTALCFFQPIGAYFRPHPGTSKRPIFNWLHWLVGNAAHIIAIVTIFFAVKLTKAELPEWFDWIMVAFVAIHVLTHLVLSIMNCAAEKSLERRVTSFPMKDLGGTGRTSSYIDRNVDAPYSGLRKFLLALYIIIIIIIVVALIFITVVAPVEDFWKNMKDSIKNK